MRKQIFLAWTCLTGLLSAFSMSLDAQDSSAAATAASRSTTSLPVPPSSPAAILKGMNWRNIGPNRGGRSLGIAGSSRRKMEYYFGAVGGGLWKTPDGGFTWKPVTDGQIASSSVGAVAVSESKPDIVYIGTGETRVGGKVMQGDGVYKSLDGGKTWKNIGLKNTQSI